MAASNLETRRGSCLCCAIQFTATGEPLTFFVCHCGHCRKATGAAFMANAIFKAEWC
ncbi:Mss4-like protein [Lyophyllum atratum]|nr:Mss4-like protein [Lyophyllum atratum]